MQKKKMIDYFNVNKTVWIFFKKYLDQVQNMDKDKVNWSQIYEEANAINSKYDCQYCHDLLFVQLDELERIFKTK